MSEELGSDKKKNIKKVKNKKNLNIPLEEHSSVTLEEAENILNCIEGGSKIQVIAPEKWGFKINRN